MSGTWKMIEVVGTSSVSFAEAARNAVRDASRTVRGMAWFEVVEQRGAIDRDAVKEFQVKIAIGLKVEPVERAKPAARRAVAVRTNGRRRAVRGRA